jgi:hypothetical protein
VKDKGKTKRSKMQNGGNTVKAKRTCDDNIEIHCGRGKNRITRCEEGKTTFFGVIYRP